MTFQRTRDWALVKWIATHPMIWPNITDDFAPEPADWKPRTDEEIIYLIARDGDEVLGMFIFFPDNPVCWDVHVCMLPSAWGPRSLAAFLEMFQWVWANTNCMRIVGAVPKWNRRAALFALKAGMECFGINRKSHKKYGTLHDMALFGVSKPGEKEAA